MDYQNVPPDELPEVSNMVTDFRQRVGEKAFQAFLEISRKMDAIKEEYGQEPQPDYPQLPYKDNDERLFLELAELFYSVIKEDPAIKSKPKDEPIDEETMRAAVDRAIARLKGEDIAAQLPSATSKRPKDIAFPIDKVNAKIWKLLEKDTGGQITFAAENLRDRNKGKEINIFYSIDFSALNKDVSITRQLEPFDKRVYIAIGALWAAGNQYITIKQIFYAMGGDGNPAHNQIMKIEAALKKMLAARVDIDNAQEAKAYKYKDMSYHGNLLPMEFVAARINGATVDGAIHIFREPPLITFARERKQITTIKRQLLTTPLNKTNENIMLEDCLIESIAHMRNGRRNKKILFTTLYAEAHITEKKQRQRAPEKIKRVLDYFKKVGNICGYTMEKDGVILDL